MENISKYIKTPLIDTSIPKTRWQNTLKSFLEHLNENRGDYPEIKIGRLLGEIRHIKGPLEKETLYKYCLASKNFASTFWWAIKPNSNTKWAKPARKSLTKRL